MAGRPRIHKAHAVMPNGIEIETRTIGCKPYVVVKQFRTFDERTKSQTVKKWEVHRWCDTMEVAHNIAQGLRTQYGFWLHKQIEVQVLITSCHITTGKDQEE